nr:hypothetical protein [Enterobacter sp.]
MVLKTVQDIMLGAVEHCFGNGLPISPVEWLTYNGSCYRANETCQFTYRKLKNQSIPLSTPYAT